MAVRLPECVIRPDGAGFVLLDRQTRAEYVRGTEAEVLAFAAGAYDVTDAPLLGPVALAGYDRQLNPEFVQPVEETKTFRGREFVAGASPWTDGTLYPDYLGIAFTERLADVPRFVLGVERLAGRAVTSVQGTASVAFSGPSLLGDWIRQGRFDAARLARRFGVILGGDWVISVTAQPGRISAGFDVSIDRVPGS